MRYENDQFIIYYNSNDENIRYLIITLEQKSKDIMEFFELKRLSKKIVVKIYDAIEDYKEHLIPLLEQNGNTYHEWMIGDTLDDNINILALKECRKLESHKNHTLEDQAKSILHEFVHICHHELIGENNSHGHIWLSEALATNLSGQDYSGTSITCTYEELKSNFPNASNKYATAFLMGKYMLENYGRDFILNLIKNWELLDEFAPKLFEETKSYHSEKMK